MSAPAATRTTATIAAEVHQLTAPIHIAHRGRIHTHPPLLDQLRDACTPNGGTGSGIRHAPASRPPIRLDAIDHLAEIYTGISAWHARLRLPSPPRHHDWQMAVLRALSAAASGLDPQIADWLAIEIHDWWHTAAVGSGWQPAQLAKLQ